MADRLDPHGERESPVTFGHVVAIDGLGYVSTLTLAVFCCFQIALTAVYLVILSTLAIDNGSNGLESTPRAQVTDDTELPVADVVKHV